MSGMLDRYHKTGGFIQLLNLLETCGPQKQEKFLKMIYEEDARWAKMVEKKMLNLEKVFSWGTEVIAEIAGNLQDLTIAVSMHGLDNPKKEKLLASMGHMHRRRVEDSAAASKPTPGEINTMLMKILSTTRQMISDGKLRMDKIDPEMFIEDDIEEHIAKMELVHDEASATTELNFDMADVISINPNADKHSGGGANSEELAFLKKKVINLNKENTELRSEISKLRVKVDQIKKIMAA